MNDLVLGTLPVAATGTAALLLLLLAAFLNRGRAVGYAGVGLTALLGCGSVRLLWAEGVRPVPGALLSCDRLALFFDALFLLAALFAMALSTDYLAKKRRDRAELYGLVALAATGMMALASATNLIVFYLGLELMSLSFYVMAGLLREHENSIAAAFKYFLLGAFSSAFLLMGAALLYGSLGSLDYAGMAVRLAEGAPAFGEPMLLMGFLLFLVGLFFKLSLIPFHFWAPDVYQGAPTPVTALMAVGGKTAALAAALRVFLSAFSQSPLLSGKWAAIFTAIGLLTIFTGSMVALTQRHIKRLLAYSSVVHAGFLALGLAALGLGAPLGQRMLEALLFYVSAYLFMNFGAFAVAGAVERPENQDEPLRSFSGLGTASPLLAALFALFLFSLAGIPLTAGFLGKFYVFGVLVSAHHYWVAALGLLGAVIATYYYLKTVVALYFPPAGEEPAPAPVVGAATWAVLGATALLTLYLGVFPAVVTEAAKGLTIG